MHTQESVGRLLPIAKVMDKTSRSRAAIYDDVKAGNFPKPVRISANRVAWPESAVDAWIASKIAEAA